MVKSPTLLGPDGQPIDRALLGEEIATPEFMGVRRVIEDQAATGLTPEGLAQLLRQAATGEARRYLTLAEEMEERYTHYASQLQTRRLAIEGVAMTVDTPDGVPARIVDAVGDLVETEAFEACAAALTDGISKGYSVVEIMWEYQGGLLKPVEFKWRDPRFFVFDRLSLTELRLASDHNRDGEELAPAKFVRHLPRAKAGLPIRRGLARPAAWAFMLQSFALKDWAAFAEVYGIPLRLGKYHQGASAQQKRTLLRAARDVASDAAAIIPREMELEFIKVEGQHGAAVFGELIEYLDKQVSKLVLGQTMTSDDGSSLGQAKVHNEVRLDILGADCGQLARTLNRDVIRNFVSMNFGPQEIYPTTDLPVAEPEDIEALSTALERLVPFGLKVGQRHVRERIGVSEPAEDDELLSAPATVPVQQTEETDDKAKLTADPRHGAGCQCPPCATADLAADPDAETDDALASLLTDNLEDWEEITDPLLIPIREAIDRASSFDEALELIAASGPDGDALAERLAQATAIARGLGDVTD